MTMNSKEKIQHFMEQQFLFRFGEDASEDSDLFKLGVIDSFGYIQLMQFLKQEFELELSEDDLLSDVLVSFAAIDAFVAGKMARSAPAEAA
jgi:D-alanine--poly(phosphoribitol) ligase subunit 2